ncbi:MAG: ROK family protein [Vicinamibacteria bacterium]|nr:ROK family protein [Vicinamibacteria bacterium]
MRIGIDLGGTKIEGVALDASGATRARRRVATPRDDYDATLRAIAELVAALEAEAGERGTVGVGMPGAISPATGRVKNANSTWLNGRMLKPDLEAALGREVRFANDANCFAVSEARDGAAAGRRLVFGVIVGTGTGGGIAIDGHAWNGPNAIAGEWGHNPLPWPRIGEWPGPACYCGKHGCIETFLSGPGLARDAGGRSAEELAAATDVAAREALARHADRMARALASVLNLLDPDAIVLGGGLSNLPHLYEEVPRLWGRFAFSDRIDTPLLPPLHGDASGVRGAAWLWE